MKWSVVIVVALASSGSLSTADPIPLLNGDAEAGDTSGWTIDESEATGGVTGLIGSVSFQAQSGTPPIVFSSEGSRFFSFTAVEPAAAVDDAGNRLVLRMSQSGNLPAESRQIDFIGSLQTGDTPDDRGRVVVQFFDASGPVAQTNSSWIASPDIWRRIVFSAEVPAGATAWALTIEGRLEFGRAVNTFWDGLRLESVEPCSVADTAFPYRVLDLSDVNAFVDGFLTQDPLADLDQNGMLDLADIGRFIKAFLDSCGAP